MIAFLSLSRLCCFFLGKPPLDRVLIELNHQSEFPTGMPGMKDIGIEHHHGKLSEIVLESLRPYRPHEIYYDTMDEIKLPEAVNFDEYLKPVDRIRSRIVGDLDKSLV